MVRRRNPEDFYSRLDKTPGHGPWGDCWPFSGAKLHNGYGALKYQGNRYLAHRLAWILAHGPVPAGLMVRHKCDNRPCCNLAHLELGTHTDNMQDKMQRGRHVSRTGEDHYAAKLGYYDVIAIHHAAVQGVPQKKIAAYFGVSQSIVSDIVRKKSWKDIYAFTAKS